jgi:23S rRNA (uracil1939-C5)-methyltransferase
MTLSNRKGVNFFEHTNDGAAEVLVGVVEGMFRFGQGTLVDAYSGAGFFGHRLAPRFDEVLGIETHEGAVASARKRAHANERYMCGDVGEHLGSVLQAVDRMKTSVLLDPPAIGVQARVTDILGALPVARIVYVSCDPATQARDIGALVKTGYRLKRVVPVDMFPQTADVEVVAELEGPDFSLS